jgi:hypothetical protein
MSYGPPQPPGFGPPPPGYGPPPQQPGGYGPMPQILMPPPGQYVEPPRTNGLAVASLVCGILAIVPGCCCGLLGIPLSIVAIVMGIVGMSQINASQGRYVGKGLAIAGLSCGGAAVALDILGMMFNVADQVTRSLHV